MTQKSIQQLTDIQLVERFRHSHDNVYMGHLFQRYAHLILGLCMKYFKNPTRSEDAVMSIFELLLKELKKHDVEHFKSWLYIVTKNYCLQELRKDKASNSKQDAFQIFLQENVEFAEEMHHNSATEKEKLLQRMEHIIPLLKYSQRQCIKMFYLQGKTYADISEETGYSLKEIKSHIQNGKRNLKLKMLEQDHES